MKTYLRFLILVQVMWLFNSYIIYPQWANWYQQTVPSGVNNLSSISFIGLHGIAGGAANIIYTVDGGNNWLTSSVPANGGNIRFVQMINDNIGYAAGAVSSTNHGYFLKTSDNGASWVNYGIMPEGITDITGLCFLNESVGFVTIDSSIHGGVLKTTNGGLTWNKKLMLNTNYSNVKKIVFANSTTGFITAAIIGLNLMKTTDAGETWQVSYSMQSELVHDLCCKDENNFYFVTELTSYPWSKAYRTSDGGTNWFTMPAVAQNTFLLTIKFYQGSNTGFIIGGDMGYSLFKTTDGGNSWSDEMPCPGGEQGGLGTCLVSEEKWYLASGSAIYLTLHGGTPVELTSFTADIISGNVILRWSTSTETNNKAFEIERSTDGLQFDNIGYVSGNGTTTDIHTYSFADKITQTGKYFYRIKQIDFDGKTEFSKVIEVNTFSPESFSLNQNYPNPFNPVTQIKYSIPVTSVVSIKVFDILGKEIKQLVNETKEAGTYEISFDASALPSGIYFYRLESGSFIQTNKMTLLR